MAERIPSFFVLVPGPWVATSEVIGVFEASGIQAVPMGEPLEAGSVAVDVVADDWLAEGFAHGRSGPLPADILHQVANHCRAALVEVAWRLDDVPERTAAIGRILRDAGGVAVRMEASGCASDFGPWLRGLESGIPSSLYETAIVLVRDDDGIVFTCGMHQFDLPDAEIATADSGKAVKWLDAFSVYQIAESPILGTGHTFCPDEHSAKRKLERWPDHRHHPDDGRYNPFGVWRLLADAEDGFDAVNPVPVMTPSLVVQLLAAERGKGAPLTQSEVERLVDGCPAIAMDLSDVVALERSRGYADLEPRRAWEQWQLVRSSF
jgi:hypothetical protein